MSGYVITENTDHNKACGRCGQTTDNPDADLCAMCLVTQPEWAETLETSEEPEKGFYLTAQQRRLVCDAVTAYLRQVDQIRHVLTSAELDDIRVIAELGTALKET
jgi:hypothetical protein